MEYEKGSKSDKIKDLPVNKLPLFLFFPSLASSIILKFMLVFWLDPNYSSKSDSFGNLLFILFIICPKFEIHRYLKNILKI